MLLSDKENIPVGSEAETYLKEMVLAGRDNAELVKRLREFYRPATSRAAAKLSRQFSESGRAGALAAKN